MTVGELRIKINAGKDYLTSQAAAIDAERFGFDLCAAIADRVINEGKTSTGNFFKPYSTKPINKSYFFGRSRTASAERAVRNASPVISYKDFRRLNNLPTDFKNFSFSNFMWSHFGVLRVNFMPAKIEIIIGGTNMVAAERIEQNSRIEGRSIIRPSATELSKVASRVLSKLNPLT